MKTETVKCDGCACDLTYTGNSVDYRIVLASERLPHDPAYAVVTDMMIYPPIPRTAHFCGMKCLLKWASALEEKGGVR